VVVPAGMLVDWLLGVSASTHAFGDTAVANTVLTAGTAKTNTESTPNMTSEAFLWFDFIGGLCRNRLYIAYEAAIHRNRALIHILRQ
jgi:hypothetical protein